MNESTGLVGRDPLPWACALGPDEGPARLLRWKRLQENASPVAHVRDGHVEVRYQPAPGVLEELTALAAAEQTCCSFVAWAVTTIEGRPVLRVTAPTQDPDAVEPIAALFNAARSDGSTS
jgi:hypothetical protein